MSSGVTVVTSVTMILFTVWFGNFILRTVDVLYKPSVKKWIRTSAFEDDVVQQTSIIKSGDKFFLHFNGGAITSGLHYWSRIKR